MSAECTVVAESTRMPRLMEDHPSSAYQAGRLLAVCQLVQDADERDINATFTDRYFAAASNCPARVLPQIVEVTLKRNKKLMRSNPSQAVDFRQLITRIHTAIEHRLPGQLNLTGKADFQLGYFHQHACRVAGHDASKTRYRTNDGKSVKSYGELRIANLLYTHSIEYQYEPVIPLPPAVGDSKSIHPDFSIQDGPHQLFIEYLGLAGIDDYDKKWRWKLRQIEDYLDGRLWVDVQTDQNRTSITVLPVVPEELASRDDDQRIVDTISQWRSLSG